MAKSKTAATSKVWVYKLHDVPRRSDDPAAPKDWSHWFDEGDGTWTKRGDEKEVGK